MANGFGSQNFGNLGQPFAQGMSALGSPFSNIPQGAGPNAMNAPQGGGLPGGDVPAFDLPPMQSPSFNPMMNPGMQMPSFNPMMNPGMMPFQGQQQIPTGMSPGMAGGQGPMPQMSQDDIINMLYQTQLGRAPDQGGSDFWRQQMQGGMTQDQVRDAFRQSQEGQQYQQRMAPMVDDFGRGRRHPPAFMPQMQPEITDALRLAMSGINRPGADRIAAQRQYAMENPGDDRVYMF